MRVSAAAKRLSQVCFKDNKTVAPRAEDGAKAMHYIIKLFGLMSEGLKYTAGLFVITIVLSMPLGLLMTPRVTGTDGFFVSVLRRSG